MIYERIQQEYNSICNRISCIQKELQTLPDGSSKNEKEALKNAQLLLECYEERLYLHEMLYKDNPTELLKNAILKDKMLIKKWKEYISKRRTV